MRHTFTNPPPPQPPPGSCTACQFFFMPPAQSEGDNKWLLVVKVATLLILVLTLIRCLSVCLRKFGNICSGGSSPSTNNISSGGQALSGGSSPSTKITNEISLTDQNGSVNDSITV